MPLGRNSLALVPFVAAVVLGFAEAASATVTFKREAGRTEIDVAVDGVRFEPVTIDGREFTRARLEGVEGHAGIYYREGAPELPVVRFFVEGDVVVRVGGGKSVSRLDAGKKLVPSQAPRIKLPDAPRRFVLDSAAYARQTPDVRWSVESAGSVNGVTRRLVTLYPLSYAPDSGEVRLIREFTVVATGPAPRPADLRPEVFAFVVGEKFRESPSLRAYSALKESLGYEVDTIVVATSDTADAVRERLRARYLRAEGRLRHALIVGDSDDVPGYASMILEHATDHYYRAIDTDSYATDINGPDIGVGRISVASEEQLAAVLAKNTRYVRGEFADEGWLSKLSWVATDDRHDVAEGTHNYVIDKYATSRAYTGVFPGPAEPGGDKLYAITHRVTDEQTVEAVRAGRAIIDYSGHGGPAGWDAPRVSAEDVRSFGHADALPFVIGNACSTADFYEPETFGETFLRHPHGAVVYWGSIYGTFWDEDDILERALFDHVFRDGARQFARLTDFALGEVWKYYGGEGYSKYYWETYETLGDPSLDLRVTRTRPAKLAGPDALPRGAASVAYTLADEHGPVSGARVALVRPDGFKAAGTTDANGRVTLPLGPATAGPADVLVTAFGADLRLTEARLRIGGD